MKFNTKNAFFTYTLLITAGILFSSHTLYLKMDGYFLEPGQETRLSLYNGSFDNSENSIARDRMLDASLVAQGERTAIASNQWEDQDSTITYLSFKAGAPGTYVAGVATKPRNIALTAEKFNDYLQHDGVVDMLAYRTKNGLLDQDALESYEKHVKAIYQVGDTKTDDWKTVLGYPIEFVPQENPYEKYKGDTLAIQLLLEGAPLSNQLVYIDYSSKDKTHTHGTGKAHTHGNETHTHDGQDDHTHASAQELRTNEQGIIEMNLPIEGIYYLRTIHMVPVTNEGELTHRSKWATLSFEVTHQHGDSTHTHDHHHSHDQEEGFPTWGFVLISVLIIALLFLLFRKKSTDA